MQDDTTTKRPSNPASIFDCTVATYNFIRAMTHPVIALLTIGLSVSIILHWQSTGPWADFFQLIILAALSMKVLAWIIWASLWEGWEWVEDEWLEDDDDDMGGMSEDIWRTRDEEEITGMAGIVQDEEERW
ncbi:hypothetical protein V490_05626 [Pseudogymnoascus sp. VKM F-3557]|nr:hypothetical protein V490_05626 [Pseudogymnoascus sp. VKM F-3557]